MNKTAIIIPIRSGSKGIPGKNIKLFLGYPLFYWTLQAACKSKAELVVMVTESLEYLDMIDQVISNHLSEYKNKIMVVKRPCKLAQDHSKTEETIKFVCETPLFQKITTINIFLVQATSPLLQPCYLDDGIDELNSGTCDSVISVVDFFRFFWKESIEKTHITPVNYHPIDRPNRQFAGKMYIENGVFYGCKLEVLKKIEFASRIFGNIKPIVLPKETIFEIDDVEDWELIESMARKA